MASSSSKVKQGSDILVHGFEWKALDFKLTPMISKTIDPSSGQSQIPLQVLLCTHLKCLIQEIGTLEMDDALGKLCVNGFL